MYYMNTKTTKKNVFIQAQTNVIEANGKWECHTPYILTSINLLLCNNAARKI